MQQAFHDLVIAVSETDGGRNTLNRNWTADERLEIVLQSVEQVSQQGEYLCLGA